MLQSNLLWLYLTRLRPSTSDFLSIKTPNFSYWFFTSLVNSSNNCESWGICFQLEPTFWYLGLSACDPVECYNLPSSMTLWESFWILPLSKFIMLSSPMMTSDFFCEFLGFVKFFTSEADWRRECGFISLLALAIRGDDCYPLRAEELGFGDWPALRLLCWAPIP